MAWGPISLGGSSSGYTLPAATNNVLGGVKIGSNLTILGGVLSLVKDNVIDALGFTPANSSHTHDLSAMINALSTGSSAPEDADYYVSQYAGGGTSTVTYHRRPMSALWAYIKAKADALYQAKGSYAASSHSHSAATQSAAGFLSAADKKKLDGIATGANAYSLPAATASVLGGVKTGSNITNSSGTISLTKANVTAALGYTPPTTNTTYGAATSSAFGLVKTGSNITNSSGTISMTKANVTSALGYTPPTTNTTYGAATSSAAGLMSAADKAKLDAIATGGVPYRITFEGVRAGTGTQATASAPVSYSLSKEYDALAFVLVNANKSDNTKVRVLIELITSENNSQSFAGNFLPMKSLPTSWTTFSSLKDLNTIVLNNTWTGSSNVSIRRSGNAVQFYGTATTYYNQSGYYYYYFGVTATGLW